MRLNSTERRRRTRRVQEFRAMLLDFMGVIGLGAAAALLYVVLVMMSY
jgi:hypothetical protein